MSHIAALRRLKKELDELRKHPHPDMSLGPIDDSDMFTWEGILNGPENTPYSGGIFKFRIEFDGDYPMKAPHIKFVTKIYHPNISTEGEICVDILKKNWSSAQDISKVMISIASLLTDPNPGSALNGEAARLYTRDKNTYNRTVKEWVKKYASPENL